MRRNMTIPGMLQWQSLADPAIDAYGEMMEAIAALRQES